MTVSDKILDRFISKGGATTVATISDYKVINDTLVKVIATFNTRGSKEDYRKAIGACVDNQAVPVEGSFQYINVPGHKTVVVGFLSAAKEILAYDPKLVGQMKAVTANVLMDKSDNLWDVTSTMAGKVLVRRAEEDLGQLVSLARVRSIGTPTIASLASTCTREQEFATYVDVKSNTLHHGFVVEAVALDGAPDADEQLIIVPSENPQELEEVPDELVVESRFVAPDAFEEIAKAPIAMDKQKMKDYYAKIYGYNPAYLEEFFKVIDNNSAF